MAETLASALFGAIFQRLTDEALKKFARSQNIHSELNDLQSTLTHIEALLNDASRKEVNDESVRLWLNNLQHLAYDIDDILDDVATEAMRRELTPESGEFTSKVRNLIPTCCTKLSLTQSLHHKLDSITSSLQLLEKQKSDLGLVIGKDEKQKSNNRGNETSLPELDVVGREGEKENLINKLLGGESSKENFNILPIVGMGGVGKTTLARLLYNDTQVQGHFELQAWVCVSDFDIVKISNSIFQSVTAERNEFKDLNLLQMALREKVKDKRLLLVVDDVWIEKQEDWGIFVRPFYSCAPGSKIIMTTRKDQLLKMLGFDHLDRLESLSDRDALSLLALHALGVDNFDSHPTLRPKGEGIVGKCGGLPLALKAIGTLLRTKIHEEDWDDVLNSEIWDLEKCGDIVPALRLSYHDLSSHLKQFFAYCSLFPKDFLFDKDELVLLWMAEGYLLDQSHTNNKAPEDLGHEYFDKLLSRSFFQTAPNDNSVYVMHDLMNDLAKFVAGDMFLRFEQQTEMAVVEKTLAKYRHMSFVREEHVSYQKFEAFEGARSLRTLLAVPFGEEQWWNSFFLSNKFLVNLIPQLLLLRVLSLKKFRIREVPDLIGNLKHLRYLNLSQTDIKELPENIGNLYNLQTLILFGCGRLTKLPKSFVKLKKLRHFDIRDTLSLKKLPVGIGEFRSLRTLTKIIIGDDEDGFAITELKGLSNLQGEISIEGLHNVQSATHAREANSSLRRLTKLGLEWGDGSRRGTLEKEVFNELKPHAGMLNFLNIKFYEGIEFPGWVGDPCFQKLVTVSIRGCRKCKFLPPLGQLPLLKKLFIQGMDEVEVIGSEFTGTSNVVAFSSLEILSFEDMSGWEVLEVVFPCLGELSIRNCPKLRQVSFKALPSLRILNIYECGNGALRSLVRAASSITELTISHISELTDEAWRGALTYLGAVEEVYMEDCNDIRYLWESEAHASRVLGNIKELGVWDCENLVSLGEKEDDEDNNLLLSSLRILFVSGCKSMERCILNSNSIERLEIFDCESLTRVSFIWQKLKSLSIHRCKKLIMENMINTSMPMLEEVYIRDWTDLKSQLIQLISNSIHLTSMNIEDCPRGLKKPISEWGSLNLPSSLVDLTLRNEPHVRNFSRLSHLLPSSLKKLEIQGFDKLESLSVGLQHLTSLRHLLIGKCPKLKHLPETLLPSLLSLRIYECPILTRRSSHYWPLIFHIPDIYIQGYKDNLVFIALKRRVLGKKITPLNSIEFGYIHKGKKHTMKQSKDPYEVAAEESPPESPVGHADTKTQDSAVQPPVHSRRTDPENIIHPLNQQKATIKSAASSAAAKSVKNKEDDDEEEEENMDVELGKFPSSSDPTKLAKMQ
ncbi:hypothetical protein E3N88_07833 [Mikania micrantha]|uniref:NB-ARC n=1 Tax=Mikania micrantha TaxID=192012 RepID=A0A5N6PFM3_9ASTR|nr:hypothetical protein E3N88_07833 [Mikania micrantha]